MTCRWYHQVPCQTHLLDMPTRAVSTEQRTDGIHGERLHGANKWDTPCSRGSISLILPMSEVCNLVTLPARVTGCILLSEHIVVRCNHASVG